MKYLVISLLIFLSHLCAAQKSRTQDILYLKDGSIIYGTIRGQSDKVRIQIAGGSTLAYDSAQVDTIRKEAMNKAVLREFQTHYYRRDRGYSNITEVQFMYGTSPLKTQNWYNSQTTDDVGLSLHTINGYQVWPYLYIGAGVGAERMLTYRQTFVPLYLRLSSELIKKRITPYVYVDAGYAFLIADEVSDTEGYKYYHRTGGLYITAGGGIRIYTRSRASIMICVGYRRTYSEVSYAYTYSSSPDYLMKRTYQRLVVSMGVTF